MTSHILCEGKRSVSLFYYYNYDLSFIWKISQQLKITPEHYKDTIFFPILIRFYEIVSINILRLFFV